MDICLNLLSIRLVLEKEDVVSLLYKMDNEAKGKITQSALGSEAAQLVEEFFKARGDLSWRSFVATRLPLLKKTPEILEAIRSSRIDYTKALEISKLKALEEREALLKTTIDQNLSLIEVKERVKASSQSKDSDADSIAPSTALKELEIVLYPLATYS